MLLSNTTRLDKNCSNNSDGIVCQWRNEGLYSRQKQLQILLQKAIRLVNDRRNFLERENQQLDLVDGVIENTRTILYYLTNKSKENSQQINPSSHPLDDRMNDGILLSRGKMFDIPLKQTKIEIDENNIRMDESGYSSFYQQQTTKPKERGRDTKKLYVKQFSDKSSSVTDNSSISASNSSSSNSSMIFITSSSSLSSQLSPMKKDETKEKRKNIEHRQVKFQLPKGSNTKRRVKSSGNLKHVPLEKRERILNDPRKRINEKVIYDVITGCHGPNNCQPSNPALQTKYGSWKFEYFQRNIPSFNATDMYQLHTERKYCMENELKKETKTQLPLQYHHRTIRYSPKYHNNNIHQLEVMDEKNLSRRLSEHQNLNGKLTPKTKNFNAIQSTKKIIGKTNNRSRTNEQHSQIVMLVQLFSIICPP
ncbi:hypothetical protein SNEBB_008275 [Seison nebaliae]|nr:hypothetical protein SNEBB_008275 [Seison nebaliae]